jgi:hypothetical protein
VAAFGPGQDDDIALEGGTVGEEDGRLRHGRAPGAFSGR